MPGLVLGPLFREASARFSARICARQNFYSVPVAYAGRRVQVRLRANEVAAYDGVTLLARHERSPGRGREVLEFDHYLEVLVIKAGALPGSSALFVARASGRFSATHDRFYAEASRRIGDAAGTRAIIRVLLLERTMNSSAVIEGVNRVLLIGSIDPEVVAIEARRSAEPASVNRLEDPVLAEFDREAPTISHYDALLAAS